MKDFRLIRGVKSVEEPVREDLWELTCGCVVHVRRRAPGSYAAFLERAPGCPLHRGRLLREPEDALEVSGETLPRRPATAGAQDEEEP